jgi:hypothetical protein
MDVVTALDKVSSSIRSQVSAVQFALSLARVVQISDNRYPGLATLLRCGHDCDERFVARCGRRRSV